MRLLILVAGSSLILTACGNKGQSDNTLNVDENLAAENIVSNDVTAIDAVTGDASNMAADVMNYTEADEYWRKHRQRGPRRCRLRGTKSPGKPPLEETAPDEPVTNNATS